MPVLFNKEQALLPMIQSISSQTGVPPALILAHMKQESNFDPNAYRAEPAINDASYGLMQLLSGTARALDSSVTTDMLYDPTYNTNLGAMLISRNLARYNNVQDAIAAYNAGSVFKNSSGKYISKSGNDVQYYVDKVFKNYQMYTDWLGNGAQMIDPSQIDPVTIAAFAVIAAGFIFVISRSKYARQGDRLRARSRRHLSPA